MKFVTYLRVSTDRQGQSGLGLEAQRDAVAAFIAERGGEAVAEYVEVERGKGSGAKRPELARALDHAKKEDAVLLIAKLDRLSRNVAFIANLLESGVEVTAADMPEASRMVFHIMAAVAEGEARMTSERTKAALAAAKARGQQLGFANPKRTSEAKAAGRLRGAQAKQAADLHAANSLPLIKQLRSAGLSMADVAEALNNRGIKTARNGKWHASTVHGVIKRAA